MKIISAVLTVLFTLAVTGPAFAFESNTQTNAQVYFAIPFGAPTKAEATPRFGFSIDYAKQQRDFDNAAAPYRPSNLDFRMSIAGDTSVYSHGINLGDRLNALAMEDDELMEGWIIPLGIIGAGFGIFLAAKGVN